MKTRTLLMIGMLFLVTSVFAKKGDPVPKVILIGIGAKNPTFNEALYPHLNFYYTPGFVIGKKDVLGARNETSLSGDPKFLADINNEGSELDKQFYVFDKNGLCYTQGYRFTGSGSSGTDKKPLKDTFKELLKKDKVAKASKKEMKMKKSDFLLGFKMPEYNVSEVNGTEVSIKSITEGGEPVIIIFFQLASDIDIQEAKESGKGKTGKQFMKTMRSGAVGSGTASFCENIESEFFDYDAREK